MAGAPIRLLRVRSRPALDAFIELPYRLHSQLAHWVPPLRRDQYILLNRMKHPFHEHAQVEYFLALREGEPVGRIAAIENFRHNSIHGENIGFFGFLEAIDDVEVFRALLRAAEKWAAKRGLEALRGPCSFSTNEECGLLVENFHSTPAVMTPFHPPHYRTHVEACGYAKAEDLLCWWMTFPKVPDRIVRLADGAQRRIERGDHKLTIRTLDKSQWGREIETIKAIYHKAWEKNWGFIPMTDAEMDFVAHELKLIVEPTMVLFAEMDGEPVGMTIGLPDYNQLLLHMDGRLTPLSIAKALLLKGGIRMMRLMMMGVLPEWRGRGIEMIMYRVYGENCIRKGITGGEFSWVLERNEAMNHQIRSFDSKDFRRYRIYEKALP
ncbi:MAG: hypothetical protein PWP23_3219 [Candidatus Sumerlaeota bacterium]|nr:hypothetical protein [Candidatus Sumerlaeota bacterium]